MELLEPASFDEPQSGAISWKGHGELWRPWRSKSSQQPAGVALSLVLPTLKMPKLGGLSCGFFPKSPHGPRAELGTSLLLTELKSGKRPRLLVESPIIQDGAAFACPVDFEFWASLFENVIPCCFPCDFSFWWPLETSVQQRRKQGITASSCRPDLRNRSGSEAPNMWPNIDL